MSTGDNAEMIIALHNIRRPLGNGQEAWSISRKRLVRLTRNGMPTAVADRLRRLILIVNPSGATRFARVARIERRPFRQRYIF